MKSKRDKRNYIIIGLCMILVFMGAGYAAFSQMLTINGTANISNSWCVGFDNTKTDTMQINKGLSTGTAPTGSITYSGTACGTNLVPASSLSAHFYQPGDEIEYTLTIKNASTVSVAIKSILVDNESVTSNTTKKKGNITYIVNMPESTTLAPNASTTMNIIAKFQNETSISGPYSGETKTIEVKINAEQDDGNGGMDITPVSNKYTGSIYRWSPNVVSIGDAITDTTKNVDKWCEVEPLDEAWCVVGTVQGEPYNSCDIGNYNASESECEGVIADGVSQGAINDGDVTCQHETSLTYNSCDVDNYSFTTEEECLSDIEGLDNTTCEKKTENVKINGVDIGNYTTNASTLNKNFYLKHDVVDDIITSSYVCFVYNNAEHCLKGGDDGESFETNTQIIEDYQTFYNLNVFSNPSSSNHGCYFFPKTSGCYGGDYYPVYTTSDGRVHLSSTSSGNCYVTSGRLSYCN